MPTKFNVATVDVVKQDLDALPEIDREYREVGLQEVIQRLAPSLRKLRSRGYSMARILEILKERGIQIGATTLAQYLRDRRGRSDKRAFKPPAPAPVAVTEATAPPLSAQTVHAPESGGRKAR